MPKLDGKKAKRVNDAEGGDFKPLEPGIYTGTLLSVTVKPGKVDDYWSWEFGQIKDAEGVAQPGRLWVNTSLSEASEWKLKEVFEAFGAKPNKDTDELCGERAKLAVSQRTIESGARTGELTNQVDRVLALASDDDASEADEDEEDVFD